MARKTLLVTRYSLLLLFVGGCSIVYRTPGGGANLKLFADRDIREIFERQPSAPRPVHLAIARVQAPHYRSYTSSSHGQGRYSVVTVRDVEQEQDFERLASLPDVAQVVPLNRLLLSDQLESDRELRQAAAALHADMILIYTFDTDFSSDDFLRPLTVVTLGLSPNKWVRVTRQPRRYCLMSAPATCTAPANQPPAASNSPAPGPAATPSITPAAKPNAKHSSNSWQISRNYGGTYRRMMRLQWEIDVRARRTVPGPLTPTYETICRSG